MCIYGWIEGLASKLNTFSYPFVEGEVPMVLVLGVAMEEPQAGGVQGGQDGLSVHMQFSYCAHFEYICFSILLCFLLFGELLWLRGEGRV